MPNSPFNNMPYLGHYNYNRNYYTNPYRRYSYVHNSYINRNINNSVGKYDNKDSNRDLDKYDDRNSNRNIEKYNNRNPNRNVNKYDDRNINKDVNKNINNNSGKDSNSTFNSNDETRYKCSNSNSSNNQIFLSILGIDLYFDDLLILCLLFFLYQEGVKDEMLFICLLLLLLT